MSLLSDVLCRYVLWFLDLQDLSLLVQAVVGYIVALKIIYPLLSLTCNMISSCVSAER